MCIKGLSKEYASSRKGKKHTLIALNNVSFRLEHGLYGLLGPNGAGKSTLINIITGNLKQTSGRVEWNDNSLKSLGIQFRRILGFMPQQQGLYDSFTGRQFISYLCALKEVKDRDVHDETMRVANAVNLVGELDKQIGKYSGGMKQRLLLASALIGDPKLLILDEPTAGLDPKERVRIRNLLASMSANRIIIVATHVVSDVEDVADKILLLKQGSLIDIDTVANLLNKYCADSSRLEDVYLALFGESV